MSNYRPISLLPTFSKIFEKLMKIKITSFLDRNSFFSENQFGFRSGKSTEDAILRLCSQLYSSLNHNKPTMALFIDMTKAFDMVDHDLLLSKLYNAGFRGVIFQWLKSFLKDRVQKVIVNGEVSEARLLKSGVPQGSVLGPLLFLIYINSLFKQQLNGISTAFADDISFTYQSNSELNCVIKIEEDLEILRAWFSVHKLVLSEKTKIMSFKTSGHQLCNNNFIFHGSNCRHFTFPIHYCGKPNYKPIISCPDSCFKIDSVHNFKYLGVTIDSKLNWKEHISNSKNYLMLVTRKMYLLKPFCSKRVLTSIYYGLAHSKIQYGLSSWGGSYASTLRPLLIAQKHLIRIICNKNRLTESWPLYKELRILPMRHLYVFKVLKEFFKQSGYIPSRNSQLYNLRINNMHLVTVPTVHKTHFSNFYTVAAPKSFNNLPMSIRTTQNLNSFLKKVKDWLFTIDLNCIDNYY